VCFCVCATWLVWANDSTSEHAGGVANIQKELTESNANTGIRSAAPSNSDYAMVSKRTNQRGHRPQVLGQRDLNSSL